jgi:hypothetical protein
MVISWEVTVDGAADASPRIHSRKPERPVIDLPQATRDAAVENGGMDQIASFASSVATARARRPAPGEVLPGGLVTPAR